MDYHKDWDEMKEWLEGSIKDLNKKIMQYQKLTIRKEKYQKLLNRREGFSITLSYMVGIEKIRKEGIGV